jgi:hypothetical protein
MIEEYHHENNVILVLIVNTNKKSDNVKNAEVFMNTENLKDVLVVLFVYPEE